MKKLLLFFILLTGVFGVRAEEGAKISLSVYIQEQAERIPASSVNALTAKLRNAVGLCGMGATDDFTQFYLTCDASVISRDILPGAPVKYRQNVDLTFYVVDAFSQRVFNAVTIPTNGIGNSEAKAYIACFQKVHPSSKELQNFLQDTNGRIKSYYESQLDNIIQIAVSLAKVNKYDEALFRLSQYPEICSGYDRIVETATSIYSKYVQDKAHRNLAKARAIWNAGQDAAAAEEAGIYLAEIMPEADCYGEAVSLLNEIKSVVKSNIEYERSVEARNSANEQEAKLAAINAWKEVGVAFGNNQKSDTYNREIIVH